MAKITVPDSLNVGTEIVLDTTLNTVQLVATGNLVAADGVTLQAVYSKLIQLWETSAYNKFTFPMYVIDSSSGQFQIGFDGGSYNGWVWKDAATRSYLRDGGWAEYDNTGVLNQQYVGIVSLGVVDSGAQLYYQETATGTPTDFTFTDAVNEGIQVFGDATHGSLDNRTFFKGYVREYSYLYKDSVLADTGKTSTGAFIVNLLLSNSADLDITDTDANVLTLAPYTDIKVKYFASAFQSDIDTSGTPRSFGIVVDVGTFSGVDGAVTLNGNTLTSATGGIPVDSTYTGGKLIIPTGTNKGTYTISGTPTATVVTITGTFPAAQSSVSFSLQRAVPIAATLSEIYTKVQYQLRQATSINDTTGGGSVIGKTASLLLNFVGATLNCGFYAPTNPIGGGSGVAIVGFGAADINSMIFYDNSAVSRQYPYASAGNLNFNSYLTVGGTGYYRMYFTTNPTGNYGTTTAVTVNDKDGNPIQGTISSGTVSFTFDYSGNIQGGRTGGTDAAITVVAGDAGSAKPVVATGTIGQSKTIVITLTAQQDRAYVA